MNPSLCPHITDNTTPFAGLPDANNNPRFYCSLCTVERVTALTAIMQPAAIFRMMFIEQQHAREITAAMRAFTYELKQSNPSNSLVRNRVQCVARYFANAAGLGTSKQERFQRYRFGQDDGGPPSWKRSNIVPRIVEPKSLSSFSDAIAVNKRMTYA
jgi:hypothetical protein